MIAKNVRAVRSSRFSVRFICRVISRIEPVRLMLGERAVDGQHRAGVAFGPDHDRADLRLVHAQPQQRVVELAKCAQRPEPIACFQNGRGLVGCGSGGA